MCMRKEMDRGMHSASNREMTLFIISIPFMVLAVSAAVIPLIVLSYREHQRHTAEYAARAAATAPTTASSTRSASSDASEKLPVAA